MKHLIYILAIGLVVSSCRKEHMENCGNEPVSFSFGTAYGECGGNCANFFIVKDGNVYPDNMQYYTGTLSFLNTPLSHDKYVLAKQLVDNFPAYLTNHPNVTLGCPDCHDQGGIHIELTKNGVVQYWHIDNEVDQQPLEIRGYVQQLVAIVVQL